MLVLGRGSFFGAAILVVIATVLGCAKKDRAAQEPFPRPVTVLELRRTNPTGNLRLTGSVEPWKEEDVAFEVGGRVEWIVDQGQVVQGRLTGPEGQILSEGTALARLDTTPYELAIATAEAEAAKFEAQITAARIELDEVLPQKLAAAEAHLDQAKKDLDHLKRLVKLEAGSATEYYREEALYRISQATVQELQATAVAKRAELGVLQATQRHAQEKLKQARKNLADCTLVSRLGGLVSEVHVMPGAVIRPGQAVAHVIIMETLVVKLAVPTQPDRAIAVRDFAAVYPPGHDEPVSGVVWSRDTVPDPAAGTRALSILVSNQRGDSNLPADPQLGSLPRITDVWPITQPDPDNPGSKVATETSAICTDSDEGYHYVWHVEDLEAGARPSAPGAAVRLRKVRVEVGEDLGTLAGVVHFRELLDTGGLPVPTTVAAGVPQGVQSGDLVLVVPQRWQFHPGDLVEVVLDQPAGRAGYYVPTEAILPEDDTTGHVFLVEDGRAAKVQVELTTKVGQLQRIEAKAAQDDGRITDGAQLILKGVHYLVPGEPVRVLETEELEL